MKYDIIYADPPWKYEFSPTANRAIEIHYPTMELEDIKKMDIPSKDNSILFLWSPAPKLKEALEVIDAWGFIYRTSAVWDKEIIGLGSWFRMQHELLLIGKKGTFSPPDSSKRVSSVIKERRKEHSKKPDKIRYLINQWYPNKTKLELFARDRFEGWDCHGNELSDTTQKYLS